MLVYFISHNPAFSILHFAFCIISPAQERIQLGCAYARWLRLRTMKNKPNHPASTAKVNEFLSALLSMTAAAAKMFRTTK